jgi:hypothetical protein
MEGKEGNAHRLQIERRVLQRRASYRLYFCRIGVTRLTNRLETRSSVEDGVGCVDGDGGGGGDEARLVNTFAEA